MAFGQYRKKLFKRAQKGMQGYPIAAVSLYGPNHRKVTKIVCTILPGENQEPAARRSWETTINAVRCEKTLKDLLDFIGAYGALSIGIPTHRTTAVLIFQRGKTVRSVPTGWSPSRIRHLSINR